MKFLLDLYLYENVRRICFKCGTKRYAKFMIPSPLPEKRDLQWSCSLCPDKTTKE